MRPLRLRTKLILLIFGLLLVILSLVGSLFTYMLSTTLENQIGERALRVAQAVASIPAIREAFNLSDPSSVIQPLVEEIREKTGAEFIVVGNKESIRYSHPVPERIGKRMVGGDNDGALLEGKSYISEAVGTLGPSLRGKVPIRDEHGEIIGIVSVGFLIEDIDQTVDIYQKRVFGLIVIAIVIGVIGAMSISDNFKKAIFGLEPNEIAGLLKERNAILESIREGIIAINDQGTVTMVNPSAYKILGLNHEDKIIGKSIIDVIPGTRMIEVLETGKSQFDREMIVGENEVIVNRIPIFYGDKVTGVVSSFRSKSEIDLLSRQLSQVQKYAEALRAQTHEYSNKLHTIAGLIQLESYHEAIDVINKETTGYQELIQFLMSAVPDTMLAAILLGKYNQAVELKVDFQIDKESSMKDIPSSLQREKLVTVLGNLLENAFEAVLEKDNKHKRVTLFMTDIGNDLIFEVEDAGKGVPEELTQEIFKEGYSTKKGKGRGIGLALVDHAVKDMGGYITISKSQLGGAAFTVVIPKKGER